MLDRLTFLEEEVAWAAAAALAISGILFLWWGLWEDRSRGRRRCPRCQYGMAGVPGLVCPECGCDARRERRLFKTRRRWTAAALGLLLVLLAIAAPNAMPMYRHGWRRALPTWALLTTIRLQGWPTATNAGADPWTGELIRRYKADDLGWGRNAAITAMTRRWSFEYRKKWPKDVPIVLRSSKEEWWGSMSLQVRAASQEPAPPWVVIGLGGANIVPTPRVRTSKPLMHGLPAGATHLPLDARLASPPQGVSVPYTQWQTDWGGRIRLPITIVESVDECIMPTRSQRVALALRGHATVMIQHDTTPSPWVSLELSSLRGLVSEEMAVALRVELLRDGRVAAQTSIPLIGPSFAPWPEHVVRIYFRDDHMNHALMALEGADRSEWQVRIRPDALLALHDLDATTYWDGDVTIRMVVVTPVTKRVKLVAERPPAR